MEDARKDRFSQGNNEDKTEANVLLALEGKRKKKTNILKQCLYDPIQKRKVLHSLWIGLIFVSLGMTLGQNGPTILDLQIVTNTDLETSSFFLNGLFIGYLVGSALCGIIYDRVQKNLFMLIGVLGLGTSSIITPYCFHYVAMIFIRFLVGFFTGVLDAGGIAEQMRVWDTEGSELMQMLHFFFALGGVLSPLYSEPFLAKKLDENSTTGSLANYTDLTRVIPELQTTTTDVHYAFMITGLFCFISGIPWLIVYLQDVFTSRRDAIVPNEVVTQRKLPTPVLLYMIFMISLIYFLYSCLELGFVSFLTVFLVEEYNETKSKGAQLTSLFWATFAASRFVMIFFSQMLTAVQQLFISCFLTAIICICFTINAFFSVVDALAILSAALGFVISGIFPAGISWTESHLMKVTSRVSASIMVSISVAGVINPILTGYLMENIGSMWFCYLLVIEAMFICFSFLILFVTSKFFISKHYAF